MRIRTLFALTVFVPVFAFACGGGQVNPGGPATPDNAASGAPASTTAATDAVADAGPATTTTMTLGDGGDLQGAKLQETKTVASTSAAPSTPPPGCKPGHEPGRGVKDIQAIVAAHRDQAKACYTDAKKNNPSLKGSIVVQWTIDPKGTVTRISLDSSKSTLTDPGVAACVTGVIKGIQFADSPCGYESQMSYPFGFGVDASK